MAAGFGAFGGLGGLGTPMREVAPNSNKVASPFVEWGGSPEAWQTDWQRRYDEEAAKFRPAVGSITELLPGATGYNAESAHPHHSEQRQTLGNVFDMDFGHYQDRWQPQAFDDLRGQWVNAQSQAYTSPAAGAAGASHTVSTPGYTPGYQPDFDALNAERGRLAPLAEQQMRQQQAYDWMQGGNQDNALMSPDYANAGFNTITGMSNPNAGPGQIDGVGMDWAQGVYDPTTQQGTGTYQPSWQRNTNFGW